MQIKVLGASGSEVPGRNCPAFLVDGTILLDAGTVGMSLHIREEAAVSTIVLTHAHFDHIKGIPFLLDNRLIRDSGKTVTLASAKDVIRDLRKNIFNDRIWPDFTRIPSPDKPVLRFAALVPARTALVDGFRVTLEKVDHTVPAYGVIVEDADGAAIAYTGDTGPTERLWKRLRSNKVGALIVETSLPNRMEELALRTGHLTPALLEKEIAKMRPAPPAILLMHAKPQYRAEIERDVVALGNGAIRLLMEGEIFSVQRG